MQHCKKVCLGCRSVTLCLLVLSQLGLEDGLTVKSPLPPFSSIEDLRFLALRSHLASYMDNIEPQGCSAMIEQILSFSRYSEPTYFQGKWLARGQAEDT